MQNLDLYLITKVLEFSYDGIYITDKHANTLLVNRSYERITGLSRNKIIGANMEKLVSEGIISESVTLEVLKTGSSTSLYQQFNSGKRALVTGTPIFDDKGEIVLVVTNVRDITELLILKEENERNKELSEKYQSAIEEIKIQLIDMKDFIAVDKAMIETIQLAKRVARLDTTVLITGETGVGKEKIASLIHENSTRKDGPYLKVNCGAIPYSLIESELFGYEKGSFTGASREGKMGFFEMADGGTILLDEIGELSLDKQVKLLRVLEEGEIIRVGGTVPIKVDVRILAATNRNLEEMVRENTFREDLYYRLNVVPIIIPPLRNRNQDIIELTNYFLAEFNKEYSLNKIIHPSVISHFLEYSFPGNVRELRNIVERMVVLSAGNVITKDELPITTLSSKNDVNLKDYDDGASLKEILEEIEMKIINEAYYKHGNAKKAAKALGMHPSTYVRKRMKYGIVHD